MTDVSLPATAPFARVELERTMVTDEALESLSTQRCQGFLPKRTEAAPIIAKQIIGWLKSETPASLTRVGEGEGSVLGLTGAGVRPEQLLSFNTKFLSRMNGTVLDEREAVAFCQTVRSAIISADIIGFRAFDRDFALSEMTQIRAAIEDGNENLALGLIYAREFLQIGLVNGSFVDKILTSAWIHLALIPYLPELMSSAQSVVVITGRAQLEQEFEKRLGDRLRWFLQVPTEGYRPATEEETHLREAFPQTLQILKADLRGALVLVGAGYFGKVYCQAAKTSGAVAVDLGSAFDVLAGIATRPSHRDYDLEALRWI
jgi:hypothetical protein